MKMKHAAALSMAALMGLSLVGCGGSRNIILIWNIYLTILIPFVVLLSGIWHITSFMIRQTHRLFIIVR